MILIVDSRELQIIPLLQEVNDFRVEVIQETYGDYVIIDEEAKKIRAVIERKTLIDYGASIKDGRSKNREKMLKLREDCGCDVYYIVEGSYDPPLEKMFGGIQYKSIRNSIDNLMTRDKIFVIQTMSQEHTARRLTNLVKSYQNNKPIEVAEKEIFGGFEEIITKLTTRTANTDDIILCNMWKQIDGIGEISAKNIAGKISFIEAETLTKEQLEAELKKYEIPHATSIALHLKTLDDTARTNVLSEISGVSTIRARAIIAVHKTFTDIVNNISELKINNRKLGDKLTEKIKHFLGAPMRP